MGDFMKIFEILGIPLGWLLWAVYKLVKNYFVSIFLFTLIVRLATFPFSLKSQKSQAERAKLAPRLERIQKKYKGDYKKIQEKQTALYEKHGISQMGGCLPMLIPMVVLFGVIAVIYAPLQHLARIPQEIISVSTTAVTMQDGETPETHPDKVNAKDMTGYYKELRMLLVLEKGDNRANVEAAIAALPEQDAASAAGYVDQMVTMKSDFKFFGDTLLDQPWVKGSGFNSINILWLIPLISCATAFLSSLITSRMMKTTQQQDGQPGQGCMTVVTLVAMPLFSLYISFTVPGAVGVYWICSNIIAVLQTVVMNKIYNPAVIRAQAYEEDAARRQQKAEDKKRLAEARQREEAEARREAAEKKAEAAAAKNAPVKTAPTSKNPNKQRRREETAPEAADSDTSEPEASTETPDEE